MTEILTTTKKQRCNKKQFGRNCGNMPFTVLDSSLQLPCK